MITYMVAVFFGMLNFYAMRKIRLKRNELARDSGMVNVLGLLAIALLTLDLFITVKLTHTYGGDLAVCLLIEWIPGALAGIMHKKT